MSDRILVGGRIATPIIWNMKEGELIKALFFLVSGDTFATVKS